MEKINLGHVFVALLVIGAFIVYAYSNAISVLEGIAGRIGYLTDHIEAGLVTRHDIESIEYKIEEVVDSIERLRKLAGHLSESEIEREAEIAREFGFGGHEK